MLIVGAVISFAITGMSFGFQNRTKDFGLWWNNFGWLIFVVLWIVATVVFFRLGLINGF
jgi:hypothetical protein